MTGLVSVGWLAGVGLVGWLAGWWCSVLRQDVANETIKLAWLSGWLWLGLVCGGFVVWLWVWTVVVVWSFFVCL